MRQTRDPLDTLDTMLTEAVSQGHLQLEVEEIAPDGRIIRVNGNELVNFGNCGYLGLERDPRLAEGVLEGLRRHGTQFASSRAYLSAPSYRELEELLGAIFERPTLATPTTTLGHMAAIPVLVGADDAVILDQQVHNSVQMAVKVARFNGAAVHMVRHNDLRQVEHLVESLRLKHRHIWFMGDGVYSMHGDLAPMTGLTALLQRYEQFHVYLDDAHGMSWTGKHGSGVALDGVCRHERAVVAVSLVKAFAAGGGAIAFPNAELLRRVKTCGGPMIFSGPIQPPMLGAAVASARLHLTSELSVMQQELRERIARATAELKAHGLPLVSEADTPIRFVGLGLPRVSYAMLERLRQDGYYVNVGMFPAVPMRRSGIRFTITRLHTPEDIEGLVGAIARHLPDVLESQGTSMAEIAKLFGLEPPRPVEKAFSAGAIELSVRVAPPALSLQHETTIAAIAPAEWDELLGANGTFTHAGLRFLEASYQGHDAIEHNWNFHYYIVRDGAGKPVAATFFTEALWKDDMLAPEAVSRVIEAQRETDPYFLTGRHFSMGALLTEGDHLYLDRTADWRGALKLVLEAAEAERAACGANSLVIRDLAAGDAEMDQFLRAQGFVHRAMPESLVLPLDRAPEAEYLASLSRRTRRLLRETVLPYEQDLRIEVLRQGGRAPTDRELAQFHALCENVRRQNLELNTFPLPPGIFERMLEHPGWEIVTVKIATDPEAPPVGVAAYFIGPGTYVPMVVGLDYEAVRTHGLYRQFLLQAVRRGKTHGAERIYFGMGATLEKQRMGARTVPRWLYVQANDHYHEDLMAQMARG